MYHFIIAFIILQSLRFFTFHLNISVVTCNIYDESLNVQSRSTQITILSQLETLLISIRMSLLKAVYINLVGGVSSNIVILLGLSTYHCCSSPQMCCTHMIHSRHHHYHSHLQSSCLGSHHQTLLNIRHPHQILHHNLHHHIPHLDHQFLVF